jgi:hypothetical protein
MRGQSRKGGSDQYAAEGMPDEDVGVARSNELDP